MKNIQFERSHYRILMFSPNFAPMNNAEAIVNSKLALAFLSEGWHIDVISHRQPSIIKRNKKQSQEWISPWLPLKEITHRIVVPPFGMPNALKSISHAIRFISATIWVLKALFLALSLHRKNRYHAVISRSYPYFSHLPALFMNKVTDIPWIANWNDPIGIKISLAS